MPTNNTRLIVRTDYLLAAIGSTLTVAELVRVQITDRADGTNGYVPTVLPRSKRHGELARNLRQLGLKVWTGTNGGRQPRVVPL